MKLPSGMLGAALLLAGIEASRAAGAARHSTRENSFSTGIGTETTFGLPQAVDIRIVREKNCMVVVNRLLTTATTRPAQSTTGAPEAP